MNTSVSPSIPSFPDLVLVLNFRIWGPSMRIIKYLVRRPPPRSVCVYVSRNLDLVATDNGEGSPLASGSGIFQLTFKFIVKLFYEYLISLWAHVLPTAGFENSISSVSAEHALEVWLKFATHFVSSAFSYWVSINVLQVRSGRIIYK